MKKIVVGIIGIIIAAGALAGGYFLLQPSKDTSSVANTAQQQAPPVSVMSPEVRDVVLYYEFTGKTQAVETVDIVARVSGYLEEIKFEDGADVQKGDLLFTIEDDRYKAQYDQAFAQLQSRKSELVRAEADLHRFQEAIQNNAVSKQDLTTKQAEYDQAQASVIASMAALAEAELNLRYTRIKSPVDGRINRNMVDAGNLVGVNGSTVLATVVALNPMYIYFNVSETLVSEIMKQVGGANAEGIPFQFAVMDEQGYPHEGTVRFIDNRVDPNTGTILLRGEFNNEDKQILPGMFVRLKLSVGTKNDAVLVQDTSLLTDIGGKYLLTVDEENTVKRCPVVIGQKTGDMRVIESGLTTDKPYINTGLQFLFPGMKVNPQAAQNQAGSKVM
ncbi:MAG: efflux RND transporter periplasmic adaptor subunit [Candidatus Auribacterota bacterium]